MRRLALLVVVGASLIGAPALADNDVGCGLGTQLWDGSSGFLPKILAATTNQWLGTQTGGITSGTSGCAQGGVVTAEYRAKMFVADNFDRLAREMAIGGGETLDSLAVLLEIEDADHDAFAEMAYSHFTELVPSTETTAGEMLATLDELMRNDAILARYASS
jgi:hypothetical protein